MKKFLAILISTLLVFSVVACGGGSESVEPVYDSAEQLDIGMWVGISDKIVVYDDWGKKLSESKMSEETFMQKYVEVAESGVNIAFPGYEYMIEAPTSYNLLTLKAAKKAGIKQIIAVNSLRQKLLSAKTRFDAGVVTREELVQEVKDELSVYTTCEDASALYGVMIKDEPDASYFDALGYAEEIFKEAVPNLMFYVNLFPIIGTGAQFGGSTPISYDVYLSQYFQKVKTNYVSYDHYPLYKKGNNYSLEVSFLQNMEIMRNKIDEEGENRKMWTFLQSIEYGSKNRALESVGDATFQAYSFLAYGGSGIQWFCYACPPPSDGATFFAENALVDRNFEKTATYTYVQTANRYVQSLMPYYKNFTWKGVMTSSEDGGENNFSYITKINGTKTLKSVSGTQDALVGVFADKEGRDGYMVVNFTDPAKKLSNTVSLKVENAKKSIVVKNGEKTIVDVNGGKITIELLAGEGCFVIPY